MIVTPFPKPRTEQMYIETVFESPFYINAKSSVATRTTAYRRARAGIPNGWLDSLIAKDVAGTFLDRQSGR